MVFVWVAFLALFLMFCYFIYHTYIFQFYYHKYRVKRDLIDKFMHTVKGHFVSEAYFGPSHKVISSSEYCSLSNRDKVNFSKCYNIVKFKTMDVYWELYFNLIRDGRSFSEVFNLRAFPHDYKIKSEGNVEKSYSRLNIFTNNRYLTEILEGVSHEDLGWLVRYNGDILLVSYNNLHFKAFLDSNNLSANRTLDMVKAMNNVKSRVYKKDVLEY